jgi:hypothetical protein
MAGIWRSGSSSPFRKTRAEIAVDVLDITLRVTGVLERNGIGYFLGGSLASSFQGEPRATNDIDLVVDLEESQVGGLAAELGADFDVDEVALRRAAAEKSSWNVIYLPTATKIDLFVLRDSPFDRSEFTRRRRVEVRAGRSLFVKSPEDTVLRKLIWYRTGGEVSDRQWRDVVQVLRQSRAQIEARYLDEWAGPIGVADLLQRARKAAEG